MLNHFIYTGILFPKSSLYQAHHNMGIPLVIIRSFGSFNQADIKQDNAAAYTVNLAFRHLDIFFTHDIFVDLIQLRRHDFIDKFLPKHPEFIIFTIFNLFAKIF